MATRRLNRNAGISRIDQIEKRTHGFFVRLRREKKIFNAFFADKSHGGKRNALEAARKHYRKLLRQHGYRSRRDWAQIARRKGASGIVGVRRTSLKRGKREYRFWLATWSPRLHIVRRRIFSVRKYGASGAKALAIQARRAGVRSMKD